MKTMGNPGLTWFNHKKKREIMGFPIKTGQNMKHVGSMVIWPWNIGIFAN